MKREKVVYSISRVVRQYSLYPTAAPGHVVGIWRLLEREVAKFIFLISEFGTQVSTENPLSMCGSDCHDLVLFITIPCREARKPGQDPESPPSLLLST